MTPSESEAQLRAATGAQTQFNPLAHMYAHARTLRIADGPDEVHMTIARREIRRRYPGFGLPGAAMKEALL